MNYNKYEVSEEDRLDTDKVQERDKSNGERISLNGAQNEDEEKVTKPTENKHDDIY
jgi:hypothetical protein